MKTRNYIESADRDSDAKVQRFQNSSGYYLLYEASVGAAGSGRKHRLYTDPDYALVYTWNARCTNGTTTWAADTAGQVAYRFDVGTSLGRSMVTGATTMSTWTDADWAASSATAAILGRLSLSGSGIISLLMKGTATDETLVPGENMLYGDNIPKAWANINISGGGGSGDWSATYRGFNVASVSRVSDTLGEITLATGLTSTAVAAPVGNAYNGTTTYANVPAFNVTSATTIQFRVYDVVTHSLVDLQAASANIYLYFALFGRQA